MVARAESIVLLNTGHGKGKSSAAFGGMGRGWARGWRVGVVQFVKGGKWKTGERKLADHLGIEWHTLGGGFTWDGHELKQVFEVDFTQEKLGRAHHMKLGSKVLRAAYP